MTRGGRGRNAGKTYVVIKGHTPGIYPSWSECEKQVKGFSGALFKGFADKDEAVNYWKANTQNTVENPDFHVYTDGSYQLLEGNYKMGYGWLLLNSNQQLIYEGHGPVENVNGCNNYIAELSAIIIALRYLYQYYNNQKFTVIVHTDCNDILHVINNEVTRAVHVGWQMWSREYLRKSGANLYHVSQLLLVYFHLRKQGVQIQFKHVYAHSNHHWNERVDQLADQGAHL